MRRDRSLCAVLIGTLLLAATAAHATQVRPLNLEEMTERADRIFRGALVASRSGFDPALGLETTALTFEVQRGVKGPRGGRVTIRVVGGAQERLAGLPDMRPGEEVILFLYPDSRLGLTSAVGLAQGAFSVARDKAGREHATNLFGNAGLFRGLSPEASRRLGRRDGADRPGPFAADELLDAAERLGAR